MKKQVITIRLISELNLALEDALLCFQTGLIPCDSLDDAWRAMSLESSCLIILDASALTMQQTLESISRIRLNTFAPILIIAPVEATGQLLDAGADICLQSTDSIEHIISSSLSLLRRFTLYNHYDTARPNDAVIYRGQLTIDPLRYRVTLAGEEVVLQPREFRLLWNLARNPGIVFSSERIGEILWPDDDEQNRDVTALIAELRRKLGDEWDNPTYIETIRCVGYRFLPKW